MLRIHIKFRLPIAQHAVYPIVPPIPHDQTHPRAQDEFKPHSASTILSILKNPSLSPCSSLTSGFTGSPAVRLK